MYVLLISGAIPGWRYLLWSSYYCIGRRREGEGWGDKYLHPLE